MFRLRDPAPTEAPNRVLAGLLACIAGFVNAAGFLLIGAFTSHVTGNVGRFANDLAARDPGAAFAALTMVLAFFAGAFFANLLVESPLFARRESAVALALASEAALLGLFVAAAHLRFFAAEPRGMDANAAVLCMAMGMQNSLITRLSGATVRTTHLTGVVTDLGIEAARWVRWRSAASTTKRPDGQRLQLFATIVGAFTLGAIGGAVTGPYLHRAAMLLPICGLVACALYALRVGRTRAAIH